MKKKELFKITWFPVLIASLCCVAPIVLVLLGVATVSFGASLSDTLYYDYKWLFRSIGFVALVISLIIYFRKKGVCTLSEAKRRKNEIINTVLIVFIIFLLAYILFLYGVIEIIGVWMGLWELLELS